MDSTSEDEIKGATPAWSQVPLVPKPPMGTQAHPKKGHIRLIISLLICLAWLCPITILLVLNWKAYIVGASVGCGFKHNCDYDPFAENPFAQAQRLDKRDHNIMGALQFVAKALEVWFIVIAACLAYDLTMILAAKRDGLPIGYLMTHVEFSDLKSLFDLSFWGSVKPLKRTDGRRDQWNFWLCGFVFFMFCLCVLSNLMGPATAVLVLPAQGWRDMHHPQATIQFERVASADPPSNLPTCVNCDASALAAGNYTCTNQYSATLDQWSSAVWAGLNLSVVEFTQPQYDLETLPITEEGEVSFTFNITADPGQPIWTPSRQVLWNISTDVLDYSVVKDSKSFVNATEDTTNQIDPDLYKSYRNSLKALIHRTGPIFGFTGSCYRGNVSVVSLLDENSVRCYNCNSDPVLVKCIHVGPGWGESKTNHSQFFIGDPDIRSAGDVEVDIYSSAQAVYFNTTSLPCSEALSLRESRLCWDHVFATEPSSDMRNISLSQQIFEYTLPRLGAPNATKWCENYAYYNLSDYTIDPDDSTNPLLLVELNNMPNTTGTDPMTIHPDWFLAGWSVARSGTVDGYRAAARNTVSALKSLVNSAPTPDPTVDGPLILFAFEHFFTVGHTMSLVNYDYVNVTAQPSAENKAQPRIEMYVSLYVWAYGLDTRTSHLGVVVAIAGSVVVILRVAVGLITRSREKTPIELVAAALEHVHRGELEGLSNEREVARVRYRVGHDDRGGVVFAAG
jgi:hypothetical protein